MTDTIEPGRPGVAARLGWRVERRPRPAFAHVLGGAAGAFVVVGVTAFVVEVTSDDPTTPGVVFNLVLIALALLLGLRAPGPIRSACVTAIALAVPLVWFFAFFGGGSAGRGEIRGVYLLTFASWALLYLLTWTKGRAVFLAFALLAFASWASFEVSDTTSSPVPFQSRFSVSGSSSSSDFGVSRSSDPTSDSTAAVALCIGLVFLGVGTVLDRRRYAGAATPFVVVGAVEALAGAIVLGANQSVLLAGLLAIAAGGIVGLVGTRGDGRRATTWVGVLAIFGGCVAVISDIAPDSAAGVGGIAFGFALILGSIAWWLAPVLGEPDDGDDTPRPTPTDTLPDPAAA